MTFDFTSFFPRWDKLVSWRVAGKIQFKVLFHGPKWLSKDKVVFWYQITWSDDLGHKLEDSSCLRNQLEVTKHQFLSGSNIPFACVFPKFFTLLPRKQRVVHWKGSGLGRLYPIKFPFEMAPFSWGYSLVAGGWFQIFFIFTPPCGNDPIWINLTSICFRLDLFNHRLVVFGRV